MDRQAMSDAIHDFLSENSEYVTDFQTKVVDGQEEVLMSTDGMIAFTEWMIKTGRGDTAKSKRFREALRQKFGK